MALECTEACVTLIYTCVKQELLRVLYPKKDNLGQRTAAVIG